MKRLCPFCNEEVVDEYSIKRILSTTRAEIEQRGYKCPKCLQKYCLNFFESQDNWKETLKSIKNENTSV